VNSFLRAPGLAGATAAYRAAFAKNRNCRMNRLLSVRQEACQAYVRGPASGNYTSAYEAAGYARNDGNASRLASEPHIQERIAELTAENEAANRQVTEIAALAAVVDKTAVLAELKKVGFANMFDYLHVDDDERVQVDLSRINRDKGMAIRDVRISYDDETHRVKSVSLKLYDKRLALTELMRQLRPAEAAVPAAAGAAAPTQSGEHNNRDDLDQWSNAAKEEFLVSLLARLGRCGIDIRDMLDRAIERGAITISPNAIPLRELETLDEAIARNRADLASRQAEK